MNNYVSCPRCKAGEPPERRGPYFDPCHLCEGTQSVTPELATAYRLCVDMRSLALRMLGKNVVQF
jgi:hypothetical protein